MVNTDLTIVVCCNKKDFFLARICIASIRYYYPDISIELIKDLGNGKFDSNELEKRFTVKLVDLGVQKMGWSGAKFHYLYHASKGKKVLLLDADIVFIGPFLERMENLYLRNDYVVSASYNHDPYSEWTKNTYFDTKKIELAHPEYNYPGYFFNAGQIFVTVGTIEKQELNKYFDKDNYPFWKNKELFTMVDQSVLNYLLPTLHSVNKLKLETDEFMIWGESREANAISLNQVSEKSFYGGLIHWAGCLRIPFVRKMSRGDILSFFEDYYYQKIPFGLLKKINFRTISFLDFYLRNFYRKSVKKILKKILNICRGSMFSKNINGAYF